MFRIPDQSGSEFSVATRLRYLALWFSVTGIAIFVWIFLLGLVLATFVKLGFLNITDAILIGKLLALPVSLVILVKLPHVEIPKFCEEHVLWQMRMQAYSMPRVVYFSHVITPPTAPPRLISYLH